MIGTSDGQLFEDEWAYAVSELRTPITPIMSDAAAPVGDAAKDDLSPKFGGMAGPMVTKPLGRLFGVNEEERHQTWPEKAVRGALQGIGEFNPTTARDYREPGVIESIFDAAGLAVFGPAPIAAKVADGTLGSIAGIRAKGIKYQDLDLAQAMETKGFDKEQIWQSTGFFKGHDDKWRREIPSDEAHVFGLIDPPKIHHIVNVARQLGYAVDSRGDIGKEEILRVRKWKTEEEVPIDKLPDTLKLMLRSFKEDAVPSGYLPDFFHFPKLYEAYPALHDVQFVINNKTQELGSFNPKTNMVTINAKKIEALGEDVTKVVLHELQHKIQQIEEFGSRGSNLQVGYWQFFDRMKETTDQMIKENPHLAGKLDKEFMSLRERALKLTQAGKDKIGYPYYYKNPGEKEARLVEERASMTPRERYLISPAKQQELKDLQDEGFKRLQDLVKEENRKNPPPEGWGTASSVPPTRLLRAANENTDLSKLSYSEIDKKYTAVRTQLLDALEKKTLTPDEFQALNKQHTALYDLRQEALNLPTKGIFEQRWKELLQKEKEARKQDFKKTLKIVKDEE